MIRIQLTLITILLCCFAIVSCEYTSDVLRSNEPNTDESSGSTDESVKDTDDTDNMDMVETGNTEENMDMQEGSAVVINELMADNDNTIADPQGDYDDWLELYNRTDNPISISGMYLSDDEEEPTKWQFPDNIEIPANGYLIVWLDEDLDDTPGLHADIKLSKGGEMALLVDTDGSTVLDHVVFGEQETDVSYGRLPNGTGEFQVVDATPGAENGAE